MTVARLSDAAAPAPRPGPFLGWSAGGGFAVNASHGLAVQRTVTIDEVTSQVEAPATGRAVGRRRRRTGGQDYEGSRSRYDRIRSRFATELLLDRERMGLLIDG